MMFWTDTVTERKIPSLRSLKKKSSSFSLTWVCTVKLSHNTNLVTPSSGFGFVSLKVKFSEFSPTRTDLATHSCLGWYTRPAVGIGMIFISRRPSVDFTIGKLNILNWALTKGRHSSAIADHNSSTGHNIKWDHFEILTTGKSNMHCRKKKTLLMPDLLKPALINENVGIRERIKSQTWADG